MIDRVEARISAGEPITRATESEGYSRATYYRVSQRRVDAKNETHPETAGPHTTPPGDGSERAEHEAASGAAVANESNAAPRLSPEAASPQPAPEGGVGAGTNPDPWDDIAETQRKLNEAIALRRTQEVRA
jgi:hypothetical protein